MVRICREGQLQIRGLLGRPQRKLTLEAILRGVYQIVKRNALQGVGTDVQSVKRASCVAPMSIPYGHGFLAPKLGGLIRTLFLLTA